MIRQSPVLERLDQGGFVFGLLNSVPSPLLCEMIAHAGYHFVILDYLCVPHGGDACAGDDAEAVAWVTAGELDAYGVNAHAAAVIRKGLAMAAERAV